ncbi:MAG TPA: biotin/lipoyl-containing protein [Vicinamibacterales bacterium]|nr:biotin/lipoyl-containing protein [Vicinamibacterales bacterium]
MAVMILRAGERDYSVEVTRAGVIVDGAVTEPAPGAVAAADADRRWVFLDGEVYEFQVQRQGRRRSAAHHSSLTAPMPATVIRINVSPGAAVKKGETLLVLEAMKMELPVRAPADGTVATISCRVGDLVQPGVTLAEIDD